MTYANFVLRWPQLILIVISTQAYVHGQAVGVIASKVDLGKGYIAMLAVKKEFRRQGIGKTLVAKTVQLLRREEVTEVTLETEVDNVPALKLYEDLGFTKEETLTAYYFNGQDACRLKLSIEA